MNPQDYTKLRDLSSEYRSIPYRETEWVGNGQKGWRTTPHLVPTNWHWDFARSWYYKLTKIEEKYFGTFQEFMKGLEDGFYQPRPYNNKWITWILRRREGHAVRTKFRQHGIPKKTKTQEDVRKKEWKRKKRQRGKVHPYAKGPGPYYKKSATRKHRSIQRQAMAHGRYDDLDSVRSHKGALRFYDWW